MYMPTNMYTCTDIHIIVIILCLIKLNNIIRITFCVPHQSMLHFLSLPQLESLTL